MQELFSEAVLKSTEKYLLGGESFAADGARVEGAFSRTQGQIHSTLPAARTWQSEMRSRSPRWTSSRRDLRRAGARSVECIASRRGDAAELLPRRTLGEKGEQLSRPRGGKLPALFVNPTVVE